MSEVVRGPCDDCRHARQGTSIADQTYRVLLEQVAPQAQPALARALADEEARSVSAPSERDFARQSKVVEYSRRPTHPAVMYCGFGEFEGSHYICEVKNSDEDCPDFSPSEGKAHRRSCSTCSLNQLPVTEAFSKLEEIVPFLRSGETIMETVIRPALQQAAENEYVGCVQATGRVRRPLGYLPRCTAWSDQSSDSTGGMHVVGPVVNAGDDCPRWNSGTPSSSSESLAELDRTSRAFDAATIAKDDGDIYALMANAANLTSVEHGETYIALTDERDLEFRQAKIELIATCLQQLRPPPALIQTVSRRIAATEPPKLLEAEVRRAAEKAHALLMGSASTTSAPGGGPALAFHRLGQEPLSPTEQPIEGEAVEFEMVDRGEYVHPLDAGLTLTTRFRDDWISGDVAGITIARQQPTDSEWSPELMFIPLSEVPRGVVVPLLDQQGGPMPIAIAITPDGARLLGYWLPTERR